MPTTLGVMTGAVLSAGGLTTTWKVAGASSKVPLVVFAVWVKFTFAVPGIPGVTVSCSTELQLKKLTMEGVTVAALGSLEATVKETCVVPVMLQPFLPSPFAGVTAIVTEPLVVVSGSTSRVGSGE